MIGNVINRHDAVRLARKLRQRQFVTVLDKLRIRGTDRVVAHFSDVERESQEWYIIPGVHRRWNSFASGSPDISFPQHVADKWLSKRSGLYGLSLGCGTGHREIAWAELGVFEHITGLDISPESVEYAMKKAAAAGLDSVLSFRVGDVRGLLRDAEQYDVVLGLHSLHHFDHIEETFELIARLLKTDGLLIADEFVGPTKFQWTRAQIQAANALLASLPVERRVQADGRVKRSVYRPSLLSMRLDDPSEAVESSEILPALRRWFTILEERPYGGTVLQLALSGIARNFLDDDPETVRLLNQCFAAEDEALPRLGHDFVFAVARPKRQG